MSASDALVRSPRRVLYQTNQRTAEFSTPAAESPIIDVVAKPVRATGDAEGVPTRLSSLHRPKEPRRRTRPATGFPIAVARRSIWRLSCSWWPADFPMPADGYASRSRSWGREAPPQGSWSRSGCWRSTPTASPHSSTDCKWRKLIRALSQPACASARSSMRRWPSSW